MAWNTGRRSLAYIMRAPHSFSTICSKSTFSPLNYLYLFQKLVVKTGVGLSMNLLFSSTDLFVYLDTSTTPSWLPQLYNKPLKWSSVSSLIVFFFLRVVLSILNSLHFHIHFRISLCTRILIGITLNLKIILERIEILLWSLPIYNQTISLHLFGSPLISLSNIL